MHGHAAMLLQSCVINLRRKRDSTLFAVVIDPALTRDRIVSVGALATRITLGKWLRRDLQCPRRDELLDGEIFYSLKEAQITIEERRRHHNTATL